MLCLPHMGSGIWWENIKNDIIKGLLAREGLGVKAEGQGGIHEEFADRDGSRRKKKALSEGSA